MPTPFKTAAATAVLLTGFLLSPAGIAWGSLDDITDPLKEAYGDSVSEAAAALLEELAPGDEELTYFGDTVDILRRSGFSGQQCLDYFALASQLVKADISLKDLASKVREGVAKKVAPDRISVVLRDRVKWLQSARVVVLTLESEGVDFLDKQMGYRVLADYLARGVSPEEISRQVLEGDLADYPALDNVIH